MSRVLDFADHRRELSGNRHVYAVVSRRAAGVSIGIDLSPRGQCNFTCPYCQVVRRGPGVEAPVDVTRLADELDALLDRWTAGSLWRTPPFDTVRPDLRRVVDVAFSGSGEPTLSPAFPEAAWTVRFLCDQRDRGLPLRLLTNAATLHRRAVRRALGDFDELWCKLDAGTEERFRLASGSRLSLSRVLDNLLLVGRERPIVIQSLFFRWSGADLPEEEVDAYLARLALLQDQGGRIDRVQVYTLARPPADARATPLPLPALQGIAARVRALGLPAEVAS